MKSILGEKRPSAILFGGTSAADECKVVYRRTAKTFCSTKQSTLITIGHVGVKKWFYKLQNQSRNLTINHCSAGQAAAIIYNVVTKIGANFCTIGPLSVVRVPILFCNFLFLLQPVISADWRCRSASMRKPFLIYRPDISFCYGNQSPWVLPQRITDLENRLWCLYY